MYVKSYPLPLLIWKYHAGLNLPFNILIGGEGFISSEPSEGREEASYWGGLGIRLDYSL